MKKAIIDDDTMNLTNIFRRKNRILLAELVRTDFKVRYQSSFLGYVWSVLNPLLLFAILYVVFTYFLGLGRNIEHYSVYLLTGIVLWKFFTEATNSGLKAIVNRASLIRKINFPKYIIVISGTISSLINLAINLVVVLIFIFINGVSLSWEALLVLPLIIQLYIFALGLAFFLSAANVKYRDIAYVWDVALQGLFYATPIIFPLTMVFEKSELAAQILILSPIAQVIQDVRYVLVTHDSLTAYQLFDGGWYMFIPFGIVAVVLVLSSLYFKKKSGKFAEDI